MTKVDLTIPQLALVAATRGMLGVGIGLLVADRLSAGQRRTVGATLLGIGVASTVPLALQVYSHRRASARTEH